jgi:hypothetical protein
MGSWRDTACVITYYPASQRYVSPRGYWLEQDDGLAGASLKRRF